VTQERQRRIAGIAASVAGLVVLLCSVVLTADYLVARMRAQRDTEAVAALQKKAQSNVAASPQLAAIQAEITQARRARKQRSDAISIVLIAATAIFIAGAKWRIAMEGRKPVAMDRLIQLKAPPVSPAIRKNKRYVTAVTPGLDLSVVDRIVEKEGRSTEAAIPILQAIQAHYRYLPDDALMRVCELTDVTPAQIAGVSSFYSRFRRSPVGRHVVRVCHGTACHVAGARQISEELRRQLHIPEGADTDPERMFTLEEVACLGCCSLAPVLMVDEHTAGKLSPATARAALDVVQEKEPA
jgi:NADH:ubiquinone oxidoreductase subunit E